MARWHSKKNFGILLFANTIIAVLLAVLGVGAGDEPWQRTLLENFIYSHAIGLSIFVLVYGSGIPYAKNNLAKLLALTGLFVLGGWSGTVISLAMLHFFLARPLSWEIFTSHLFLTGVLAFIFGAVVYSFFAVRERLLDTAAALAEQEVKEQQLLRLKTKAELEALRAKVNPHFLFNTLNSIASLIPTDPTKAEEMVQRLARLFRYTLEASNRDLIKLEDELRLCREYLEIEKVRLGPRLSYEITSDADLADMLLPGLLLQPLIENSVKHGIATAKNGGRVTLKAQRNGTNCCVEIADTGKGFDRTRVEEGFGLSSVRERLALHYGEAARFEMETENGVRLRMQIPLRNHSPRERTVEKSPFEGARGCR